MKDLLKFDFCEIHIYDDYVVVIINEGLTVMSKHNDVLQNIVDTYFRNKPFVYITHRLNSYSVDPATYYETSKIENLKGFAVVSKDYKVQANAEVEKLFFNKSFEIFHDLEDAVAWSNSLIKHATE